MNRSRAISLLLNPLATQRRMSPCTEDNSDTGALRHSSASFTTCKLPRIPLNATPFTIDLLLTRSEHMTFSLRKYPEAPACIDEKTSSLSLTLPRTNTSHNG